MSYAITAGLILFADRISKYLVMTRMQDGESIPLIPPVFYLTYVRNRGAAFGLFQGRVVLLSLIALVCLLLVVTQWKKLRAKSAFVALGGADQLCGCGGQSH